jgi:glycosidase
MKKILLTIIAFSSFLGFSQVTLSVDPIIIDQPVTITVDISPITCNSISNPTAVYAHLGVGNENNAFGIRVVGDWGQDNGLGQMTHDGGNLYSITLTPNTYFNLTTEEATQVTKMGVVFRNQNGTQELKLAGNPCADFIYNVGEFQVNLTNPTNNSTTILTTSSFDISATNTNGNANYQLYANGALLNSANTSNYSYTHTGITSNQTYVLEVTQSGSTITKNFAVIVDPNVADQSLPANLKEGINYNDSDNTKATLVLDAPNKDFVYVAGSFNNWNPNTSYAMKKDPSSSKFWLELTGLTPGTDYTYQYWVVDESPIANSPVLVKTADPFSTLVLSPFDDPGIPSNSYPNMPTYPSGQEREVTVLQTGQTPYNWQVTNFDKPSEEDLIIYEVLIRDFDANRNYQDLIDRIDYFKNLNVNAIQLMPVMEYEGNESWGYNTAFHMALDKYYGTEDKFKEFVDLCHQNGIAVILDIALNHAFGRNPMVRMWMNDPDGDGWGGPSSENPYFNASARHAYSVGDDFNHQQPRTQKYVQNVVQHWIEEFKIDGFRWDLTKGFTQNCSSGDEGCTNNYQQDRVDILKAYADYSWSLDPDHYVIFEHLGFGGSAQEEIQWADYRLNEGKGIMLWGKMTGPYTEVAKGYSTSGDLSGVSSDSRGFAGKRLVGYAESHDEERVLYNVMTSGNPNGQNARLFENRTKRMASLGAVLLSVPGPKMIWHFSDLGMENSIFTCSNGSVNFPGGNDGDCKLDTKPQPQWTDNWLGNADRNAIYEDWARLIELKINEPVFEGNHTFSPYINNVRQRLYIWDDNLPANSLKNVVILANFSVADLSIVPDFPYTGTWFDLMDETGNTTLNITDTAAPISIPAGQFRIFGNASTLSTQEFESLESFKIYPNPTTSSFRINQNISNLEIYDITGKMVRNYSGQFSKNNEFDITSLTSGIYIIKAQNISGGHSTTKLVKI